VHDSEGGNDGDDPEHRAHAIEKPADDEQGEALPACWVPRVKAGHLCRDFARTA
jgi:hypothetical protein